MPYSLPKGDLVCSCKGTRPTPAHRLLVAPQLPLPLFVSKLLSLIFKARRNGHNFSKAFGTAAYISLLDLNVLRSSREFTLWV